MTFSVDEFFAYSQPFGPVEKEQKSQISTLIDSGISLKWRTTKLLKNTDITPLKHTQLLKMNLSISKHRSVATLVSSTANVAQLKQSLFQTHLGDCSSQSLVKGNILMKTSSYRGLHVDPSLKGYGLCSSPL